MSSSPDANIGFTLTPEGKARLIASLDRIAGAIPRSSAILADKAGRVVDIARKPAGVNVDGICALAAGVYASTRELGRSFGEDDFSLLFEHEDEQQVFVWLVADRALFIGLLKTAAAVGDLEKALAGPSGQDLAATVKGAREPLQAVPPPRIDPMQMPAAVATKVRVLTLKMLQLQGKSGGKADPETSKTLLKFKEDLYRVMTAGDWASAGNLCDQAIRLVENTLG